MAVDGAVRACLESGWPAVWRTSRPAAPPPKCITCRPLSIKSEKERYGTGTAQHSTAQQERNLGEQAIAINSRSVVPAGANTKRGRRSHLSFPPHGCRRQ